MHIFFLLLLEKYVYFFDDIRLYGLATSDDDIDSYIKIVTLVLSLSIDHIEYKMEISVLMRENFMRRRKCNFQKFIYSNSIHIDMMISRPYILWCNAFACWHLNCEMNISVVKCNPFTVYLTVIERRFSVIWWLCSILIEEGRQDTCSQLCDSFHKLNRAITTTESRLFFMVRVCVCVFSLELNEFKRKFEQQAI